MSEKKAEAAFIEPMLLLRTERLPEGPETAKLPFSRPSGGMPAT
jgi:hypothetical protein